MKKFNKIFFLFNKKEKFFFFISTFLSFVNIILDLFSFALIIPIFNIIFLGQNPNSFYLKYFPYSQLLFFDNNGKIIILLLFVFVFIIKSIVLILSTFFILKFFHFICLRISRDLFTLYLSQNYNFFLEKKSENILKKVTSDINGLKHFLTSWQLFLLETLLLLALLFFLLYSNYKIFLFCFLIFSIVVLIYNFFLKKRIISWAKSNDEATGNLNHLITEGSIGIKDIFIYNLKEIFINNFRIISKNITAAMFKVDFINNTNRMWMEAVAVTSITFPLIYLLFTDQTPNKLIPVFALFSIAIFRAAPSVNRILNYYNYIKYYNPCFENIYNDFLTLKNIYSNPISINFKNFIEFKNVTFSYGLNKQTIFNNLNFKISKGDCISIIGDNGSGKSTLLNLISGLLAPSEGRIEVDKSQNIFEVRDSWLKNIGYVQQNIFLINSSIKYNITLQEEDKINNSLFLEIKRKLSLEKIFENFPNNLNTIVGNNGILLSGGQKQIISIARAIYKNTDIIILDEANSALDRNYMEILKELILSYKSLKTFIIVTHEIDYFKDCFDKVYLIKDKNVVLKHN
jgi:ABC-type multidrug transport system fused ATPase/permease subunit